MKNVLPGYEFLLIDIVVIFENTTLKYMKIKNN